MSGCYSSPTRCGAEAQVLTRSWRTLWSGLITADGPKVLEYNVRFGDPECQPLMSRLDSDLVEIMLACCQEKLGQVEVRIRPQHAACVVMASSGYPGQYVSGKKISGIDLAQEDRNVRVFQAGTRQENGQTISSGGRVLGVTARRQIGRASCRERV